MSGTTDKCRLQSTVRGEMMGNAIVVSRRTGVRIGGGERCLSFSLYQETLWRFRRCGLVSSR
jgi:hypothetical protein